MKSALRLRGWLRRLPWDIIAVYLVFNALVGAFARISLERIRQDMRNRSFDDLSAIAALKGRQIGDWLLGLLRQAPGLTHEIEHEGLGARLLREPAHPSARAEFADYARRADPQHRFASVALADGEGRVLAAEPSDLPLLPATLSSEVQPLLGLPWTRVSDLFRGPGDRIFLLIVSPIPEIGALVLLVDARRELFPLLREWPTASRSAETLLVRREEQRVVFLNDLRFRQGTALSLTAPLGDPRRPAAEAMKRRTGVMEGLDYRRQRVLAAWRTVPGSSWSIVAKVDVVEVDRPVRELTLAYAALSIVLGLASTLFLVLRLRQLTSHNRAEREALVTHYGYLARYANDIILLLDGKGNVVEANDRATEAYGYARSELLGLRYADLDPAAGRPGDLLEASGGMVVESSHRRKDGSHFPVEASIRSMQVGQERYVQCILRDISERKEAEQEKRRLEELLAKVQKQEAIGRLAGGVAHDLNNALTAIQGYGELLKMKLPAGAGEMRSAEGILAAVARAARVTHGLLAFSEQLPLSWEPLELNALLSSSRQTLERVLGPEIVLELQAHPAALVVRGDAELLSQVFVHLADNARRAMPQGGRFTISLEGSRGQDNAETACLRMRDTGVGMSEEVRARLFEPFFTTQGFGQGAGLGLPIVFGIVRQHGGRIEVDSEQGRGTEFRIILPLARQAAIG